MGQFKGFGFRKNYLNHKKCQQFPGHIFHKGRRETHKNDEDTVAQEIACRHISDMSKTIFKKIAVDSVLLRVAAGRLWNMRAREKAGQKVQRDDEANDRRRCSSVLLYPENPRAHRQLSCLQLRLSSCQRKYLPGK